MDGHLTNKKVSNLSHISEERWKNLLKYFGDKFPLIGGALFTPKRDNSTQGYKAGAEFQRLKEFNPTSRDHIAWILTTHFKVKLSKITTTGKPIIDEITLTEIDIPFSRAMCEMFDDKEEAWNDIRRRERMEQACYD